VLHAALGRNDWKCYASSMRPRVYEQESHNVLPSVSIETAKHMSTCEGFEVTTEYRLSRKGV
jgi:hypothetical protein